MVSRDHEPALKRAKKQIDDLSKSQKDLQREQSRAESKTLKQAAAFGLLGGAAIRMGAKLAAARNTTLGFFRDTIKAGADLQSSISLLKVFFGGNAETISGQLQVLSATSGVAVDDLTTIASRLGQTGMSAQMTAKATNLVAQAFKTLPAVERTRALNSMGLAFQTVNSFNRAFNVVLTESEQKLFNAAKGTKRFEVGMAALEKRFGNVASIVQRDLNFQLTRFGALTKQLRAGLGLSVLNDLVDPLITINNQVQGIVFNAGKMAALKSAFRGVIAPFQKLFEIIAESELLSRTIDLVIQNKELFSLLGASVAVVTTLGAAFTTLAGSIALTAASAKLFKVSGLSDIFSGAMSKGKDALFFKDLLSGKALPGASGFIGPTAPGSTSIFGAFSSLGSFLPAILAIAGALMAATAAAGIFVGLIKSGFGPLMSILNFFATGFINVAKGIGQVLRTGFIAEDLLNEINNSGFGPMFRILLTITSRFKALFEAFAGPFGTMGPVFQELADSLMFAFVEISNAVMSVLEALGLMQHDGDKALRQGIGGAAMFIVKVLNVVLTVVKFVVLGIAQGINLIAATVLFVTSVVKMLISLWSRLTSTGPLAKFTSILTGIPVAQIQDADTRAANDLESAALADFQRSLGLAGGAASPSFPGAQPVTSGGGGTQKIYTYVMVDGKPVAKAVTNANSEESDLYNGTTN